LLRQLHIGVIKVREETKIGKITELQRANLSSTKFPNFNGLKPDVGQKEFALIDPDSNLLTFGQII